MMRRILVLLTVVALMVAMMVVMAAPAFARVNCEGGGATENLFCRGGEGSQGGGFGNLISVDNTQPGYYSVYIRGEGGGGDGSGGGGGGRCTGLLLDSSTIVCHGGGSS